jgi:hypothetical protein
MKNLNELKQIPTKPSDESTAKWLAGLDECWQEFLRLHAAGHFPNISSDDLRKFISSDSSTV